jgi:chitodextrinase
MTARDNTHMIVSEIEVLAKVPGEPSPVWETSVRYRAGDEVFHDEAYHQAAWTTKKKPGGSAHGPWQEILRAGDGTAVWTASRIFVRGDVVVHEGDKYRAKWWTRNQEPGDRFGPWQVVGS